MKSYTSNEIIAAIKRSGSIPDSDNNLTDSNYLAICNEVITLELLPKMRSVQENYFAFQEDQTITTSKKNYLIPYRSIGQTFKNLVYVDSGGNRYGMIEITYGDAVDFKTGNVSITYDCSTPRFYYINAGEIVINSTGDLAEGSLRWFYPLNPSNLVKTNAVSQITAIDTTTGVVTVSSIPSGMSSNTSFDLVQAYSGHRIIAIDKTATVNTGALTFTFTPSIFTNLNISVGDYVCNRQETPYPNIPADLHPLLIELAVKRLLKSSGLLNEAQAQKIETDELKQNINTLMNNRTESFPKKIVNRNSTLSNRRRLF